jgi:hypothetical protein
VAAHPVLACAAALDAALSGVAGVDPGFMSVAEKGLALEALTELTGRLEVLRLRVIAGSVTWPPRSVRRTWRPGCPDRPGRAAPRRTTRDHLSERWPLVAAGLTTGAVNLDQAVVIVRALNQIVDGELSLDPADRNPELRPGTDLMTAAEAHLVELAAEFGPGRAASAGREDPGDHRPGGARGRGTQEVGGGPAARIGGDPVDDHQPW